MRGSFLKRLFTRILVGLAAVIMLAAGGLHFASEHILHRPHDLPELARETGSGATALMDGERLARITGCYGCHGADLNGELMFDQPRVARVVAPNLTRLVRSYSDEELDRVIRHGVRADQSSVWLMPSPMYYHLTDADLAAVIEHIRSLPEGDGPIREFSLRILGRIGLVSGQFKPLATTIPTVSRLAPDRDHPLELGRYLALIACTECHGQEFRGHPDIPDLRIVAAYGEEDFSRLMRTGVALGERELGLMSAVSTSRFKHFSDPEIEALHQYLSTLSQSDGIAASLQD